MSNKGLKPTALYVFDATNNKWVPWDGTLSAGDIQIGAVEIKDGKSDNRATVTQAGDLTTLDVETVPDSNAKLNPPKTFSYGGRDLVQIQQDAQGKSYFKGLEYDTNGNLVSTTKWVLTSTSTSSSTSTSTTTTV